MMMMMMMMMMSVECCNSQADDVVTDGHETDYEYEGSDNEEEKLYRGEPRWVKWTQMSHFELIRAILID